MTNVIEAPGVNPEFAGFEQTFVTDAGVLTFNDDPEVDKIHVGIGEDFDQMSRTIVIGARVSPDVYSDVRQGTVDSLVEMPSEVFAFAANGIAGTFDEYPQMDDVRRRACLSDFEALIRASRARVRENGRFTESDAKAVINLYRARMTATHPVLKEQWANMVA